MSLPLDYDINSGQLTCEVTGLLLYNEWLDIDPIVTDVNRRLKFL